MEPRDYRTYLINGHVCDGGDFGPVLGASDGVWSFQIRSEQQQNGSKSPRPEGLQPKSASALLLGLLDVPHRAAPRVAHPHLFGSQRITRALMR
jgi:hypothetical protein